MKFSSFFLMALMALSPSLLCAQRSEQDLTHGWRFHQGAAEGAEKSYLQVSVGNDAAVALYEKLGMLEHDRHRYIEVIPGNL